MLLLLLLLLLLLYGKCLKFSFLKLLKMQQILKTWQLTYIPPVQGYCLTIKSLG